MSTPTSTPNKVKYGLCNVHYAEMDESGETYGTPDPIEGSVSMTFDPQGNMKKFRADNMDYYTSVSNNGYDGDLEVAVVPEKFMIDIMDEKSDTTTGLQYETIFAKPKPFALLFQFEGDIKATRHVLYNCKATRPKISGKTTGEDIEPETETLHISASSRSDGIVKAKCKQGDSAYADFFKAVTLPTVTE